jgi:hypothetical protein
VREREERRRRDTKDSLRKNGPKWPYFKGKNS